MRPARYFSIIQLSNSRTVMLPVSVADICSHRRRCCSLCSMDKDAIIAVLFMDQGCPDTDGAALKVRAFGVRGRKERK